MRPPLFWDVPPDAPGLRARLLSPLGAVYGHDVYRVWRVDALVQRPLLPTLEYLLEMLHKLSDIGSRICLLKLLEVAKELLELVHVVHDLRIASPFFACDVFKVS